MVRSPIPTVARWRDNATAAHVAPLIAFIALRLLVDVVKVANPGLPWWRSAPEHWVYPLQTAVALALIAFWWRHYRFRPLGPSAWVWGIVGGTVGIAFWLLPNWLHLRCGWTVPWLGMVDRSTDGFDAGIFPHGSTAWWTTLLLRFARAAIAVPFVEEVFWTAFLWRYLAEPERDWTTVPFAVAKWRAWIGLCVGTMLIHMPIDWPASIPWRITVIVVATRTGSLGACVICHAVANLIMGLYAVTTGQKGFW